MRNLIKRAGPLLLAVSSILLTAITSLPAHADASRKPEKHSKLPVVDRSLVGGVWRVDHTFVATIQVKNALRKEAVNVTPVLYMADGTEYVLPQRKLTPYEFAEININEALHAAPPEITAHLSERGSVELRFSHRWNAINATLQNLDVPRSLIYRACFGQTVPLHPRGKRRQKIEGLWWKLDDKTGGFIDLANTTNSDLQVSIRGVTPDGQRDKEISLQIASHVSASLSLADLLSGKNISSREGGLRIEFEGTLTSLFILGGVEDAKRGFSAPMYFRDVTDKESGKPDLAAGQQQVASIGVMAGRQEPMMGFPDGTEFAPYAIIRNTGAEEISVAPTVQYFINGQRRTLSLPLVQMPAWRTSRLDLSRFMADAGIKSYSGDLHLIFNYGGVPNSLLVAAGSVDQTGNYVFDVAARGIESRTGVELLYFSERNGFDTMLTIWNPTSAFQELLLTFESQTGPYKVPIHVEANGTAMFSASELAEQNKPDPDGHTLPLGAFGTVGLTNAKDAKKPFTVLVNASTFSVKNATCGGACDCGVFPTDVIIDGVPLPLPLGMGSQLTATLYWSDGTQSDATYSPYAWSSLDTSIATIGQGNGYANSVNVGSTTLDFFSDGWTAPAELCWMSPVCDEKHSVEDQGPVNVKPVISGPGNVWWFSGQNPTGYATSITLTSSGGTGTTWAVTAGSNQVALSSTSGSSISVAATGNPVSSTAGEVKITATANSQTSDPFSLSTRRPFKLVAGTITTTCDSTFGYLTFLNYTIQDNLSANMPSSVPLNENWTTGVVADFSGTNWRRGNPGSFTTSSSSPAGFADKIGGENLSLPPTPTPTCSGTATAVDHWGQEWKIGTTTIGSGTRVQTDTIQKYTQHAEHQSIATGSGVTP